MFQLAWHRPNHEGFFATEKISTDGSCLSQSFLVVVHSACSSTVLTRVYSLQPMDCNLLRIQLPGVAVHAVLCRALV